jgi:hypothetical protein
MALGFTKQYDTSIYEKEQFIEIWPEISEIGLEISEGVLDKMDATSIITPGSKNEIVAYLKGCIFMLGFSDVDKGTDVELYDQHTSVSVIKTRLVMKDMGIDVRLVDAIDREFVEGLISLFEISDESQISKLWGVLKENKAKAQLPSSIETVGKPEGDYVQGVKKAKTDPNASSDITAPTSSVIKGQQVKPGFNFPIDSSMADKSIQYSLSKDGPKQLSPNFKVSDFKCRDGSDVVLINPSLIDMLEKIRTHFGKPVKIVSAYRTPNYNKMLKGAAKNSQHMYGNAADIKIDGVSPKEIYDWLNSWHKGGLGLYPTFTHVDVRNTVGRSLARWGGAKSTGTA